MHTENIQTLVSEMMSVLQNYLDDGRTRILGNAIGYAIAIDSIAGVRNDATQTKLHVLADADSAGDANSVRYLYGVADGIDRAFVSLQAEKDERLDKQVVGHQTSNDSTGANVSAKVSTDADTKSGKTGRHKVNRFATNRVVVNDILRWGFHRVKGSVGERIPLEDLVIEFYLLGGRPEGQARRSAQNALYALKKRGFIDYFYRASDKTCGPKNMIDSWSLTPKGCLKAMETEGNPYADGDAIKDLEAKAGQYHDMVMDQIDEEARNA